MSPVFRARKTRRLSMGRQPAFRARLLLRPLEERAVPASLVVTDGGDTGGINQLRAIWDTARTNGEADTLTFSVNSISLSSVLLTYAEAFPLTINGNGKNTTTITAPSSQRIFNFSVPGSQPQITITNLTLKGGNSSGNGGAILDDNEPLALTNVAFTQNTAAAGGAIATASSTATLTITGCEFTFNMATNSTTSLYGGGGGIFLGGPSTVTVASSTFDHNRSGTGGSAIASSSVAVNFSSDLTNYTNGVATGAGLKSGGAFFLGGGSSTVSIDHSNITGNTTSYRGGVLYSFTAGVNVTFKNSTIGNNTASNDGGAIATFSTSTITLTNDTITNNTAAGSGGAIKAGGTLTVTSSKFSGNTSSTTASGGGGGAIYAALPTVTSCTFTTNTAANLGGAIRTNNLASLSSTTFTGNTAGGMGGGVYASGAATLAACTFTNNTASTGGAIRHSNSLSLTTSIFTGNTASGSGGGAIYSTNNLDASLNVFKNNRSFDLGGAIRIGGGTSTVAFSSFESNSSPNNGGAIANGGAANLTVSNSTFWNNTATGNGGAILSSATLTINQSTFTQNTAAGTSGGGAIANTSTNPLAINNSTIYGNIASGSSSASNGGGVVQTSSGTLTLISTIVASNKITGSGTGGADLFSASTVSLAGNTSLIGTNDNSNVTFTGAFQAGTNALPLDPLCSGLADNGGTLLPDGNKIKTMSLQTGSPAIDAGSNAASFSTDQRGTGYVRVVGPTADIGAYEGPSPTPQATLLNPSNVPSTGFANYTFDVLYTDDVGIKLATLDTNDVTVTGPGYGSQLATALNVSGSGTSVTVTYTVPAPSGGWGGVNGSNSYNFGTYTVSMNANEVSDIDATAHFVAAGPLGTFKTGYGINFLVDKTGDTSDGNFAAGQLTFREATTLANQNTALGLDSITFSTLTLGASPTITLSAGPFILSDSLIIIGSANQVTLDANKTSEQISLSSNTSLTVSNINFTRFNAALAGSALSLGAGTTTTLTNTSFTGNTSTLNGGGAIALTGSASLTITGGNFSNNTAAGSGNSGGAIRIGASNCTVTIDSCTFTGNSATNQGGAVGGATSGATGVLLTVNNSIFSGNTSGVSGGAIYLTGGSFNGNTNIFSNNTAGASGGAIRMVSAVSTTVQNSSFTGNTSGVSGGAIYPGGGLLSILSSTFSKNTAKSFGGAMLYSSTTGAVAEIRNCTFSANTAGAGGGALHLSHFGANTLYVTNCTIADNLISTSASGLGGGLNQTSGSLKIESTIFCGNSLKAGSPNSQGPDLATSGTATMTLNKSAVAINAGFAVAIGSASNQLGSAIVLEPLADNGGFTLPDGNKIKTRQPGGLSLVRDAGSNSASLTYDQRGSGFARMLDGGIDIGAIETHDPTPTAKLIAAPNISTVGNANYSFDIEYTDLVGVNDTTFDLNDVTVTGPGFGAGQSATAFTKSGSGGSWTVTYTIPAPTGGWGAPNIGAYTVTVNATQVADTDAVIHYVTAGALGTFKTAIASTLLVDLATDLDDGNYGTGQLSLREAVNLTNNNVGSDTINFNLPPSTTITLLSGMTLSDNLFINGPGADKLAVDANKTGRHFTLGNNHLFTISGVHLTGGSASAGGSVLLGYGDALTLNGVWLDSNSASGNGGAISFDTTTVPTTSILNIRNSTVSGNSAVGIGGGVYFLRGATLFVSNSTLSTNKANTGGGIGGQFTSSGTIVLHNSTITGNTANTGGGLRITDAVYSSGLATIESTIISGNTATTSPDVYGNSVGNSITSTSSLIGKVTNGLVNDLGGSITGTLGSPIDAKLDVLANYGGPMPTHALLAGSPALDVGSNPDSLVFDERGSGYLRVSGAGIDMGADELFQGAAPPTVISVVLDEGSGNPNIGGVDGTIQRSAVRRIIVTFSEAVNFTGSAASAFSLARSGTSSSAGTAGPVTLVANPPNGPASSVTITFTGTYADSSGSLVDGLYNFLIDASKVSGAGGQLNGSGGGANTNYSVTGTTANKWFRYYGDQNADGTVDQVDYLVFRNALSGGPNSVFDYQNSGDVDQTDYLEFRNRLAGAP
ncbi:MAG: beta strand repeat-containing protein [Gemmataceae bacterium]